MPSKSTRVRGRLHRVPADVGQHGRRQLVDETRPFAEAFGVGAALDAAVEQHLHADADAEHRPAARETATDQFGAAHGIQPGHHGGERADAGDEEAVGSRPRDRGRRSARRAHRQPRAPSPRNARCRSRSRARRRSDRTATARARPSSTGCPRRAGRARPRWRNARANALNSASAMWCGSRPASTVTCTVIAGVEGDRLEHVAHQRPGEVAADQVVGVPCRLARVHEVWTTRHVDDGLRQSLVERHDGVAVAADARLVAERLSDSRARARSRCLRRCGVRRCRCRRWPSRSDRRASASRTR